MDDRKLELKTNPKVIYIVSDAFRAFAGNEDVMTYSHFLDNAGQILADEEPVTLVVGQGMEKGRRDALLAALKAYGSGSSNLIAPIADPDARIQELTHKHRLANVLLSGLRLIDSERFEAQLAINDQCAEMSDHVTGQHLQGALVIEASRQMALLMLDSLSHADGLGAGTYAMGATALQFHRYLFPLPIRVVGRVELRERKGETIRISVAIDFWQGDQLCTQASYNAIQYPREFCEKVEARQAKRALSAYLESLQSRGETASIKSPAAASGQQKA